MGGEQSNVSLLGERMNLGCGYWGREKKREGCITLTSVTVCGGVELADVADSAWQIGAQSRDRQG